MKDITIPPRVKELPFVSVIIPVYNAQDFLSICINSVLEQTYNNFEIICIDDGSTDYSTEYLKRVSLIDSRIRFFITENRGQGAARNLGIKHAKGKYLLFLDADDYIDKKTLETAVSKAENDNSDIVIFDWRYYYPELKSDRYINGDPVFSKALLEADCSELLTSTPIFSVNKLYKKDFLLNNDISFGEGYLYEDNPFQVKSILKAKRVSLIQTPFYRVTVHDASSTKTNHETSVHCDSFLRALNECFVLIEDHDKKIDDHIFYKFVSNFFDRFVLYYNKRTPEQFKKRFADGFLDLLSERSITCFDENDLFDHCIKSNIFAEKKKKQFKRIVDKHIKQTEKKPVTLTKRIKRMVKGFIRLFDPSFKQKKKKVSLPRVNYKNAILFMGFDHRYTGNSRYLFEEFLKYKPHNKVPFYVTDDPRVPLEYRIEPNSDKFRQILKKSKVAIFESWIPPKYKKPLNATWFQLWHGTAIKKLAFSSTEKKLTEFNPNHKNRFYNDMKRWDYLLADCTAAVPYFEDSFLIDDFRIIPYGYPRVHYLKKNKDNAELKELIKQLLGIPQDKKLVLYMPTWRDYNYRLEPEMFDLNYLFDIKHLKQLLGEDYYIVYKDHPYLSNPDEVDTINYCDAESQELLLIADYFITDYSSAVFDALSIDIPILLFCNDFEQNEEVRGVYPEIWNDLEPFICNSEEELSEMIKDYKLHNEYVGIKSKYANRTDDSKKLIDLLCSVDK